MFKPRRSKKAKKKRFPRVMSILNRNPNTILRKEKNSIFLKIMLKLSTALDPVYNWFLKTIALNSRL